MGWWQTSNAAAFKTLILEASKAYTAILVVFQMNVTNFLNKN